MERVIVKAGLEEKSVQLVQGTCVDSVQGRHLHPRRKRRNTWERTFLYIGFVGFLDLSLSFFFFFYPSRTLE